MVIYYIIILLVTFVELVPGESAWSDFFVRARDVVFFVSRHCECQCRSRCPIDWLLQNSSQWPLPAVHQTHISIRFNSILAPRRKCKFSLSHLKRETREVSFFGGTVKISISGSDGFRAGGNIFLVRPTDDRTSAAKSKSSMIELDLSVKGFLWLRLRMCGDPVCWCR